MSDTNLLQLSAAWRQLPRLMVPFDRQLSNALRTWAPSWQTQQLASETTRKLFVELVTFGGVNQCRRFDALARPVINDHGEGVVPPRLSTIVVQFLVARYDGGPEPAALSCCQVREFGCLLSTELPLLKIVDLEVSQKGRKSTNKDGIDERIVTVCRAKLTGDGWFGVTPMNPLLTTSTIILHRAGSGNSTESSSSWPA